MECDGRHRHIVTNYLITFPWLSLTIAEFKRKILPFFLKSRFIATKKKICIIKRSRYYEGPLNIAFKQEK